MPYHSAKFLLVCVLCLAPAGVPAELQGQVKEILALKTAPPGVVFEIVSGNEAFLAEAVPKVLAASARLRARFDGIEIAVVTHGREQFALMREKTSQNRQVHELVKRMTSEEEIPLHVCGTHAQWFGIPPEAFPEYIDVAAAGPAQVRAYRELGYRVVLLQ